MKRLRILPGAAGLIALTFVIGFVDGWNEIDAENTPCNRVGVTSTHMQEGTPGKQEMRTIPVYLVELMRGDAVINVQINAENGLLSDA